MFRQRVQMGIGRRVVDLQLQIDHLQFQPADGMENGSRQHETIIIPIVQVEHNADRGTCLAKGCPVVGVESIKNRDAVFPFGAKSDLLPVNEQATHIFGHLHIQRDGMEVKGGLVVVELKMGTEPIIQRGELGPAATPGKTDFFCQYAEFCHPD